MTTVDQTKSERGITFITDIRSRIAPLIEMVLGNPFLTAAETGELPVEKFRTWCIQQYPILNYDTRSIGIMMSRSSYIDEKQFFTMLLDGAKEAEEKLELLAAELGLSREQLARQEIFPSTQAYGHYLAWLAWYGNAGEQAVALTVNLPSYARVMAALQKSLETHYGVKNTDYLQLWSLGLDYDADPIQGAPDAWEQAAGPIVERYIDEFDGRMEQAARFLESYELMFWNSVFAGS